MTRKVLILVSVLLVAALALAACGGDQDPRPPQRRPRRQLRRLNRLLRRSRACYKKSRARGDERLPAEEATRRPRLRQPQRRKARRRLLPKPRRRPRLRLKQRPPPEAEATAMPEAEAAAPAAGVAYTVQDARQVYEIVNEKDTPLAAVSSDGAYLTWIQSRKTGLFRSVGRPLSSALPTPPRPAPMLPRGLWLSLPALLVGQWREHRFQQEPHRIGL